MESGLCFPTWSSAPHHSLSHESWAAEAGAGTEVRAVSRRAGSVAGCCGELGTGAGILGPEPVLFSVGLGSLAEEGQRSTLSCGASPQKGLLRVGVPTYEPVWRPLGQASPQGFSCKDGGPPHPQKGKDARDWNQIR